MSRAQLNVIDGSANLVKDSAGAQVAVGGWTYSDFPVRGGFVWLEANPSPPTDGNTEADYLMVKQCNELREAVLRRANFVSASTTNIPADVDSTEKPDYHWVTSMRSALEDVIDEGVYELEPGTVATKTNVLPLVHQSMGKYPTGVYTSGGLVHSSTDWILIGPDTDGDDWVYGDPTGTGSEQITNLYGIQLDNTVTDTDGISFLKLVDRGGGDYRWEFYAATARTVLKGYTDDFSETGSVTVRTSGGSAAGTVRVVKPSGGWAVTSTVTVQIPDKRIIWAQHINELYYACEHLCMIEVDDSATYTGGGDSKSGADYNNATSAGAYGAAWTDFNGNSYASGSQTAALKSCNVSNPSLWDCYVSNARANDMTYTMPAHDYDTHYVAFQWGTAGDMHGESLSVGLTLEIDSRTPTYGGDSGWAVISLHANDEAVDLSAYYNDDYIGDSSQVSYYYKEAEYKSSIWASFEFDGYLNDSYNPFA